VAIVTHRNLRPPNVAPIILDVNGEAHNALTLQIQHFCNFRGPMHPRGKLVQNRLLLVTRI